MQLKEIWSRHNPIPFTYLVQQIKHDSLGQTVELIQWWASAFPCCAKSNMFKKHEHRESSKEGVVLINLSININYYRNQKTIQLITIIPLNTCHLLAMVPIQNHMHPLHPSIHPPHACTHWLPGRFTNGCLIGQLVSMTHNKSPLKVSLLIDKQTSPDMIPQTEQMRRCERRVK